MEKWEKATQELEAITASLKSFQEKYPGALTRVDEDLSEDEPKFIFLINIEKIK